MKRFFYILTLFGLVSLNGFGQSAVPTDTTSEGQRAGGGGGGNKPVIDNISANSVNDAGSDLLIKPVVDDNIVNTGTAGTTNNNATNKSGVNDQLIVTDEEIAANVKR